MLQFPKNLWWMLPPMDELAVAILDEATKEFHWDFQQTYLTGLSMAGYGGGTWHRRSWKIRRNRRRHSPARVGIESLPNLDKVILPDSAKSYAAAAERIGNVPV